MPTVTGTGAASLLGLTAEGFSNRGVANRSNNAGYGKKLGQSYGVATGGALAFLNLTAAASGAALKPITGTVAVTLSTSAAASGLTGAVSIAAATVALTPSAAGAAGVSGTAAATLSATTATIGVHGTVASAAATISRLVADASSGTQGVAGTGDDTELGLSGDATGETEPPAITGTADAAIALSADGVGATDFIGTGDAEIALSADAAGEVPATVTGAGAATLSASAAAVGSFTSGAAIQVPIVGGGGGSGATFLRGNLADGIFEKPKPKPKPIKGTGQAEIALVAKAVGEHIAPVKGAAAVTVLVTTQTTAETDKGHFEEDNAFFVLAA